MTLPRSTNRAMSYFPKAETPVFWAPQKPDRERPDEVGPVFDERSSLEPLEPFDQERFLESYAADSDQWEIPPKPPGFQDDYLQPFLTRNERLRLTMLWYYTYGITEDAQFLRRLEEPAELVNELIGWEFATVGLLDSDVYTRIATVNLPLAILPRRESTCAHTVNQPAGNMESDWRFKGSPHVEIGGLRTYAGTQLRCKTEHNEEVALGSLCVASNTVQPQLRDEQIRALVRFANMFVAEIVHASRIRRQQVRQKMSDAVLRLQGYIGSEGAVDHVLETVGEFYSFAQVEIQDLKDGLIQLHGRPPIRLEDTENGLWEDAEYIDTVLEAHNHQRPTPRQTVRAVVSTCGGGSRSRCLVVISKEMRAVFDDIDSWFITTCASVLDSIWLNDALKEALQAKDTFMRGITHQLRTPIHGVLGSCDLLAEELRALNILSKAPDESHNRPQSNVGSFLSTIRTSGRELMGTVNNMLMLNRWAEISASPQPKMPYNLIQFESDILDDLAQTITEEDVANVSIFFDNRLFPKWRAVVTDKTLFQECIHPLVRNAVQFTKSGTVVISFSTNDDHSRLFIDIEDTGCGIRREDRERIFAAYEKGDTHTKGAGLGLTLASKIAVFLGGSISLVSSKEGEGSHFRVEFSNPIFADEPHESSEDPQTDHLPKSFCLVPANADSALLGQRFAKYLNRLGYKRSEQMKGCFAVTDTTADAQYFREKLSELHPQQVAICVVPAEDSVAHLKKITPHQSIVYATGPFTTTRLNSILSRANDVCRAFENHLEPSSPRSESSLSTPGFVSPSNSPPPTLSVELSPSLFPRSPTPSSTSIPPSRRPTRPVALLVDDNTINLRIIQMYCTKRHIPYITATNGKQAAELYRASFAPDAADNPALKALHGQGINLVFMDLQMPIMDGAAGTEAIRRFERMRAADAQTDGATAEAEAEAETVPSPAVIFIVTGQDNLQDRERSVKAGADQFFVKPVGVAAFDRGVQTYFEGFEGVADGRRGRRGKENGEMKERRERVNGVEMGKE